MEMNDPVIRQMIQVGEEILEAEELKRSQAEVEKELSNQQAWLQLYYSAKSSTPTVIAQYLEMPPGCNDGSIQVGVSHVSGYLDWKINIPGLSQIKVFFDRDGIPGSYSVVLAKPEYVGQHLKAYERKFSDNGMNALPCALAFAARQAKIAEALQVEQERLRREYEEKEAQQDAEPRYVAVDGSEPVPDLVLIENLRKMIREEIRKSSD